MRSARQTEARPAHYDLFLLDEDFLFAEAFRFAAGFRVDEALFLAAGERLDEDVFLLDDDFFGTLPPAFLASDSPIAIACLRLLTFFPERPLLSVPALRSCIAFSTFDCAFSPYFAMSSSRSMDQPVRPGLPGVQPSDSVTQFRPVIKR